MIIRSKKEGKKSTNKKTKRNGKSLGKKMSKICTRRWKNFAKSSKYKDT